MRKFCVILLFPIYVCFGQQVVFVNDYKAQFQNYALKLSDENSDFSNSGEVFNGIKTYKSEVSGPLMLGLESYNWAKDSRMIRYYRTMAYPVQVETCTGRDFIISDPTEELHRTMHRKEIEPGSWSE